jgi:hypothetical protein
MLRKNFFVLSDYDMQEEHNQIEEIMLLAKLSSCDFVFTTSREFEKIQRKKKVPPYISTKENDMIHIKCGGKTVLYLTLTFEKDSNAFYEFGLNPMTTNIQEILQQYEEHNEVMESRHFYATTKKEKIKLILNCALYIMKKI